MRRFISVLIWLIIFIGVVMAGGFFLLKDRDYKPQLIAFLQKTTGREVSIGRFQWTITPILGIRVENVHIGNPQGFGNTEFLSAKNGKIDVSFRSLLKGRLQLGDVTLEDVTLNLIKNSTGKTNWIFTSPKNTTSGNVGKYAVIAISNIDLKNATIIFDDQQLKKQYVIQQLNFASDNIAYNQAFPIKADFKFTAPQVSAPIDVKLTADIVGNLNKIRVENINAQTNQYHWSGWLEQNLRKKDLSAINGVITVSGNKGAFQGIDLYYYADLAESIANKTTPTKQDTHQTPFDKLFATLEIQNGNVSNHDLLINATNIDVMGKGVINLVTQQINYQMSLQRLTSGAQIKPRGPAIPLLISGNLKEPKIRPDFQAFIINNYSEQIKDKISEKLKAFLS